MIEARGEASLMPTCGLPERRAGQWRGPTIRIGKTEVSFGSSAINYFDLLPTNQAGQENAVRHDVQKLY